MSSTPARYGDHLTVREHDVLDGLADGLSDSEIAVRLGLARRTVAFHLSRTYHKMGVDGRLAAIVEAQRRGMISLANGSNRSAAVGKVA